MDIKQKEVVILIGVSGTGKSTYLKSKNNSRSLILSSDSIREELLNDRFDQSNNELVFKTLHQRLFDGLLAEYIDVIYYDATNLSRRKRKNLYNQLKAFAKKHNIYVSVKAHLFLVPLNTLLQRVYERDFKDNHVPIWDSAASQNFNNFAKDTYIYRQYISLEIPKINLDCDYFQVTTNSWNDFLKTDLAPLKKPFKHDSSYHYETLNEHLNWSVAYAQEHFAHLKDLPKIAAMHDYGKVVTKTKNKHNSYYNYINHANVSAMYVLAKNGDRVYVHNDLAAEVIFHHMNAHFSLSQKYIDKHNISTEELTYINALEICDTKARLYFSNQTMQSLPTRCSSYGFLNVYKYANLNVDFNNFYLRVARGLVLDANDNLIAIGLPKYFNVDQLADNDLYTPDFKQHYCQLPKLPATQKYCAIEKLDGTMIVLSWYNGDFLVNTSNSVNCEQSDFIKDALVYFKSLNPEIKEQIISHLAANNSLVFEYIAPSNKIVVDYSQRAYVLLASINKTNLDITYAKDLTNTFNFQVPKIHYYSYEQLQDIIENATNLEGFIIFNEYNQPIKVKTNYWFANKTNNVELDHFLKAKNINKKVLRYYFANFDILDDLLSLVPKNIAYQNANVINRIGNAIIKLNDEFMQLKTTNNDPKTIALNPHLSKAYKQYLIACAKNNSQFIQSALINCLEEYFNNDITNDLEDFQI